MIEAVTNSFEGRFEDSIDAGLIFVGGGARSGKTKLALALARGRALPRFYLATAQALDGEMEARIARHRAERAAEFTTIEAPLAVVASLQAIDTKAVVVLDCLTLWLSNLVLQGECDDTAIADEVAALAHVADARQGPTIVISNEVGMGIVPDNPLARRFRDLSGWAHQRLVAHASAVYWACFGMGLRLHPAPLTVLRTSTAHERPPVV